MEQTNQRAAVIFNGEYTIRGPKGHKTVSIKTMSKDSSFAPGKRGKCEAAYSKQHRQDFPEKRRAQKKRYYDKNPGYMQKQNRRRIANRLNWDSDALLEYISRHDGHCEICKRREDEVGTLHIDHCHTTNHFRGLICTNCNFAIGKFQDKIERLDGAKCYLLRRPILLSDPNRKKPTGGRQKKYKHYEQI